MSRSRLLGKYVGKVKCEKQNTHLTLCVFGGEYGFSGWLYGKQGKKGIRLPVSTGNARTPAEALKNGRASVTRTLSKRN